jgi:hypothetical protein
MAHIRVASTAIIDSPAPSVHAILADYRHGHPAILPRQSFPALEVERGGTGAGTVIRVTMRVLGAERTFRMEVTEPEPGRVLVEKDLASGATTTFTVEPEGGGGRSRVTIATEWTRPGLAGFVEKLLAPGALKRIFAQELELLQQVARRASGSEAP